MKHAETVTFGGSALDRAGEVRADKEAVAALRADDAARAILFWRGKVLIDPARPASVVRLPLDHPVLADAGSARSCWGAKRGPRGLPMTCRRGCPMTSTRVSWGLSWIKANSATRCCRPTMLSSNAPRDDVAQPA